MKSQTFAHMAAALVVMIAALAACDRSEPPAAETEPPAEAVAAETYTREELAAIIATGRKIVTPDGVEEMLEIPVNGTRQWISVRGKDRDNPILLMIHGGPASPEMPVSWAFQSGWEDYFTVVQWDQRGAGKTYNANDPEAVAPTLSLDQITEDAADVVDYLRQRYGKDKVFVLGHSWGSLVGLGLAHRHPEKLYAYIGMGQVIDGQANERLSYENALRAAREDGNDEAVAELEGIAPYPEADGTVPLDKIAIERKWSNYYGGLTYGRSDPGLSYYYDLAKFAPEYSQADLEAIDKGSALSLEILLPDLAGFDYSQTTQFDTPILLFEGRHDYTTPSEVAADWLAEVQAPGKTLVWFENSAHMMMMEEPGRVLVHLVQDALPYAETADAQSGPGAG